MTTFSRYPIKLEVFKQYMQENLKEIDLLCDLVVEYSPIENGVCFSVTKEGLSTQEVHEFRYGHYAKCSKEEVASIILDKMKGFKGGICISDQYDATYEETKKYQGFKDFGINCDNYVYYALEKNQASQENIYQCLKYSDSIWHSLTVVSDISFHKSRDKKITKEKLKEIAENPLMIVMLAYDGEGYVIWEKNEVI